MLNLAFILREVLIRVRLSGTSMPDNVVLIVPNDWFEINTKYPNAGGYSTVVFWPHSSLVEEGTGRHAVAHEVGHNYGLCEEYNQTAWNRQNIALFFAGGCGNSIDDLCLDEITGCDTYTFKEINPFLEGSGEVKLFNFMGDGTYQDARWITKETYNHLLSKFKNEDVFSENVFLVKGSIKKDGTIELGNTYELGAGFITTQQELVPGETSIKTLDVYNNTTYSLNFTPSFLIALIGGPTIDIRRSSLYICTSFYTRY